VTHPNNNLFYTYNISTFLLSSATLSSRHLLRASLSVQTLWPALHRVFCSLSKVLNILKPPCERSSFPRSLSSRAFWTIIAALFTIYTQFRSHNLRNTTLFTVTLWSRLRLLGLIVAVTHLSDCNQFTFFRPKKTDDKLFFRLCVCKSSLRGEF
jgi:hypothetical protein